VRELAEDGRLLPAEVRFVFAGNCARVVDLAAEGGVSAFVQYEGFLPRTAALRLQRDAGTLLLLEFGAGGVEGIVTGKVFEYLYWRKPIWVVGSPARSGAASLVAEWGGLVLGRDVERIKAALLDLTASRDQARTPSPAPDASGTAFPYTRRQQARQLLDHVRGDGSVSDAS
jgi:hypothetical protein